jgi:hypothetical protein
MNLRCAHALGAAAALLCSGTAAAQRLPSVGVASDTSSDAEKNRLIQQLQAQGYEVREVDRDDEPRTGLSARFIVHAQKIVVSVALRRDGAAERREAVIQLGPHREESATATLRALEFLRASLIDVGAIPRAPPGKHAEPAPVADRPPAREPRASTVHLGGGVGLLHGSPRVAPNGTILPSVGWQPSASVRANLFGMIPFTSSVLSEPEGEIAMRPTLFGLSVGWLPLRSAWAQFGGQLSVATIFLSMSARPSTGGATENTTRVTAAPLAGLSFVLFPGRLRLRFEGNAGTALTREHIVFRDRQVASWGSTILGASAVLEVGID